MRFGDYMGRSAPYGEGESPVDMAVRPSTRDAKFLRLSIMEEMKAINDYIERAENAENDVVRKVFLDLAEEERVHFGELELLLESVDPLAEPTEEEGEEEVEEMFDFDDDEDYDE